MWETERRCACVCGGGGGGGGGGLQPTQELLNACTEGTMQMGK